MKRNRSFWLAALLALMLFSCNKDSFLKEDEYRVTSGNSFTVNNGFSESCIDELDTTYINHVHRVISLVVYNESKRLNQDVSIYGTPAWEGTTSYVEDNEMVSVTPLVGIDSNYVRSLLIIKSQNNGYKYIFYPKYYAENTPPDIENFNAGEVYDLFNCFLFCDKGGIQFRDGDPPCWNPNSFWNRFKRWMSGILEEIGDGFGGGSAGGGIGYDPVGGIGSNPFAGTISTFPGSGNIGGGSGGNPDFSAGATFDQIQRMIALLEQFRIDENITVPTPMLLDLVPSYCADELANFNYCALDGLKSYIASNTHITETNWNASSPNRKYLSDIVEFLHKENNSPDAGKTVEVLLDIAAGTETPLTQQQFKELLDAFDLYFDDPENNAKQLVDALIALNIDPLAVDPAHALIIEPENPQEEDFGLEWGGFTVNKFWQKAGPIKEDLRNRYPSSYHRDKIERLFPCRVLGPALEEASLGSLGIPSNTIIYGGAKPDGKIAIPMYGGNSPGPHYQPFFIEVKGRFGETFDYSENWSQFTNYLNYLKANAYWSDKTIIHGLLLILPHGVSLSQDIISAANAKNIPLHLSYVELKNDDINQFRVKVPEFINISALNRNGQMFYFLRDSFFIWAKRKHLERYFDYSKVPIDFQGHANAFEISRLIGNQLPDCPTND